MRKLLGSAAPTRSATVLVLSLTLLASCGGTSDGTSTTAPSLSAPAPGTSSVAFPQAATVTAVDAPGSSVEVATLSNPVPINDGAAEEQLVLLVKEQRPDGWLEVYLPVRPNGTTGWIPTSGVELRQSPYRIEVDLSDFHFGLYEHDELILESAVGLGALDEPTPPGTYFITVLHQPPTPDTVYGPYAYGLSGFSEVNFDFGGGPGQLGLHGTNDPSSIGTNVSAGCIRLPNDVIEQLVTMLPLGTPVEILA